MRNEFFMIAGLRTISPVVFLYYFFIATSLSQGALSFVEHPSGARLVEGETLVLRAITDDEGARFAWFKDDQMLLNERRSTLIISNAFLSAGGTYYVVASNDAPAFARSSNAVVEITPLEGSNSSTNITVLCGRYVQLRAHASGPAVFEWYFNGNFLRGETNYFGESTLRKLLVHEADAGTYSSVVRSTTDYRQVALSRFDISIACDPFVPFPSMAYFNLERTTITLVFFGRMDSTNNFQLTNYNVRGSDATYLEVQSARVAGEYSNLIVLEVNVSNPAVDYAVHIEKLVEGYGNQAENITQAVAAPILIVPANAVWKFDNLGTSEPPGWPTNFSTAEWPEGAGPFSYPREEWPWATGTLLMPYTPSRISYYFTSSFDLRGEAAGTILFARYWFDDGGFIYLNGQELGRVYMGNIPDRFNAYFNGAIGGIDAERVFEDAPLLSGSNQLAVAVKQNGTNSSDVYFGMELYSIPRHPQPRLFWTRNSDKIAFMWGYPRFKLQEATDLGRWNDVPDGDVSGVSVNAVESKFFRLLSY